MEGEEYISEMESIHSSFNTRAQSVKDGWSDMQGAQFYGNFVTSHDRSLASAKLCLAETIRILEKSLENLRSLGGL